MSSRSFAASCLAAVVAATGMGCGEDEPEFEAAVADPGPVHVHGLGVNPADGALFVATHTGLFRAAKGQLRAKRVANRFQDTMGFTVTGPDTFLGSGHPDGRDDLPPFLGLIRSTDAGVTWKPVSLLGERDFHVLEAAVPRIYGYGSDFDSREAGLLVSNDRGSSWEDRTAPEPLVSLAIDPRDSDHVVASGERGTYSSTDAGGGWRPLSDQAGLLAWTAPEALSLVGPDGSVSRSSDGGRSWQSVGEIDGRPAALDADGGDLYVALHDGRVERSSDGGRTWTLRSAP